MGRSVPIGADLQTVIKAWPALSEATKTAILATVERGTVERGRGQRTLNVLSGKDLHQEVDTPTGHSPLHDIAFLSGMLLDEAEGNPPKP